DGEAGLEDGVLHPAQEKFGFGARAVETADVAALVRHSGQAHAEDGRDVAAQGLPRRGVVSRPGLRIALDPGMTGAAHDEGAQVRVGRPDRVLADLAHEGRHDVARCGEGGGAPSPSTVVSWSRIDSYSQLSFHTEAVPCSRTAADSHCVHASRACAEVKSMKWPGPPHQAPTAAGRPPGAPPSWGSTARSGEACGAAAITSS